MESEKEISDPCVPPLSGVDVLEKRPRDINGEMVYLHSLQCRLGLLKLNAVDELVVLPGEMFVHSDRVGWNLAGTPGAHGRKNAHKAILGAQQSGQTRNSKRCMRSFEIIRA
jgi:hypothetical protein